MMMTMMTKTTMNQNYFLTFCENEITIASVYFCSYCWYPALYFPFHRGLFHVSYRCFLNARQHTPSRHLNESGHLDDHVHRIGHGQNETGIGRVHVFVYYVLMNNDHIGFPLINVHLDNGNRLVSIFEDIRMFGMFPDFD